MGKNLIQQRRGRGTKTFTVPSFRYKGTARYIQLTNEVLMGQIIDLINCPGHSAPLAKVKYTNGEEMLMIAPEGIKVGEAVRFGKSASNPGNIMSLKDIPEGTAIFNIEAIPGDGGKFVRAGGCFAKITAKFPEKVLVLLPSSKEKEFKPECRASIGVIAGSGRVEKPFYKAGNKYHAMKARNKYYPRVSGVSMNAVDHPFGSKSSHTKGRPTQSARNDPPGRKVGKIAPSRTGRKKR
jgi:large subunit ribosomal protein L2